VELRAAFGVYLFRLFAPNVILPSLHASFTGGMTVYILFSGALAGIMAYAASPLAVAMLGGKIATRRPGDRRTTFWLAMP